MNHQKKVYWILLIYPTARNTILMSHNKTVAQSNLLLSKKVYLTLCDNKESLSFNWLVNFKIDDLSFVSLQVKINCYWIIKFGA